MKIDRLINIIITLSNRGRVSAKELSEKYEVSVKTIQRDIQTIELAGIPIVSFKGQDGGYEIIDNYKIGNGVINKKEIYLINNLLEGLGKTYESSEIRNLKEKLSIVGEGFKVDSKMAIDFSGWGNSNKSKEKLCLIDKALDENRIIEFSYNNLKGEESIRNVEPIKILFKSYNWYLFGYCLKKQDFRIFKIRRINDIKLKENFNEIREYSLKELFSERADNLINIKLKCTKDFMRKIDDYFDEFEIEEDNKNFNIISLKLPEDQWLYSFILGFGNKVEVLEPIDLRNVIKNKIEDMINIYK